MTFLELQAIQKEIKFDCPSMAACLGIPYNSYKNYFYGINAIPEQIAANVLIIRDRNIKHRDESPARIEAAIQKFHPYGIISEIDKEWQ